MIRRVEVELDDQGRLVVPHPLQQQLGLYSGATLVVEYATSEAAYVRVQPAQSRLVDKGGVLVVEAQPTQDLAEFMQHEREKRFEDLLR